MILKRKDNRELDAFKLEQLLLLSLTAEQKFLIERELKWLRAGEKGEKDSAYFLDFSFQDSNKAIVIHDLRLEHFGQVAQIDHLLINRLLEFYILESKNFSYGVKINDTGEFMVWDVRGYKGIRSPIEQNKRHLKLLQKIINANDIMPKRLGITLTPSFKSYVIISPASRIIRPRASKFDTGSVIKADMFASMYENELSMPKDIIAVAKIVSAETVIGIGKKLIKLHKPNNINYSAKFGIKEKSANICAECGAKVSERVYKYCHENKKFFDGRVVCYKCQDLIKQSKQIV